MAIRLNFLYLLPFELLKARCIFTVQCLSRALLCWQTCSPLKSLLSYLCLRFGSKSHQPFCSGFNHVYVQVEENTVWRLVDLLYSGSCTLYSPASADDLEELIQQLDLGGKVAELSVLEEVEPQENVEELMITKAMEKVLKRALRRKASVKRKFICSTSPAVAKKAKELEASCEVDKEIPATLRDTRICPLCGFACTSAFHLKAHLATNHFLSQLSAIVAPDDFSTEETKVLHCEKCGINFSGSRTLYRAAVHRATEHGALAPLLRQR